MGPSDVFNTLWDLDLLQQVQFVADIKDADFVLHRKQRPGERQFSYDQLRKLASSRSIPFVSVWDPGSAAELLRALTPVFQLYRGEVLPCQVARKSAQGYTSKRLRL
uniref:Uncharacterized protein n=1 Tax=Chlamydomonas leiostraca TaxID=1034604 RepID=A0A7S0S3E4_9CHLO|mmetsp:Transcript_6873/g.17120  ORF Transcript_6873/g.17120 Transcript_6873/m.17120 type:complete len:107 (+) Transcript_6873:3-323(+)